MWYAMGYIKNVENIKSTIVFTIFEWLYSKHKHFQFQIPKLNIVQCISMHKNQISNE